MNGETTAPRPPPPIFVGHSSLRGVIASEITKLRTVRSTMWSFGVLVVLAVGLSALATSLTTSHWNQAGFGERFTFDPIRESLIGVFFGQFAIGVLGVLVISAEYTTGTIRASLAAVPKRFRLLLGKIIVFGVATLIIGEIVAFASFFVGQTLLHAPAPHATISSPGALRAVTGDGLYLCLLGLIALGIGGIIRHTAAAVSAYVGLLLVIPIIIALLPSTVSNDVTRFLPASIGHTVVSRIQDPHNFSPGIGLVVLAIYAAVALGVAGYLLVHRDA
ncbi:MAG TPA: ABC transporter permease [Acidimicrobiales bacterium]|nr:ABC transporter permease [Acidimicrobiales bacterium]